MRIREVVWPYFPLFILNPDINAITLYPWIIYKHKPSQTLRDHEWVHIDQVREEGWLSFYWTYLWRDKEEDEHEAYSKQSKKREKPYK